jgi:hypothetical protein
MLRSGEVYRELGGDYFSARNPDAQVRQLVRKLEALGQHVTLASIAA